MRDSTLDWVQEDIIYIDQSGEIVEDFKFEIIAPKPIQVTNSEVYFLGGRLLNDHASN